MKNPEYPLLLSIDVTPKTEADHEKLGQALEKLTAEDPTFNANIDQSTRVVVIAGVDEAHLEFIIDRLHREFHVEGNLGPPVIAYKETRAADGETTVRLEPVMRVDVRVPPEHLDDVIADLLSRRGQIQSQQISGGMRILNARVPLSGMFGYSTDLRQRTYGRATFAMRFDRYEPCPSPDGDRGGDEPLVGQPRKAPRTPGTPGVALPEPDEDRAG